MAAVPLVVALSAGSLAAVNPCGFALLPGYLCLFTQHDGYGTASKWRVVLRALAATAAMTVGFLAVFTVFGLITSPVAAAVHAALPWVTCAIGVLVMTLGAWLVSGRHLGVQLPTGPIHFRGSSLGAAVAYGAAYAIASLSCTAGPFLALVVTTLRTEKAGIGIREFAAYAAGMGLTVGVVAVAVALANQRTVRSARLFSRYTGRAGGLLLIVTGCYVAWYGWYEIRLAVGTTAPRDAIVDIGSRLQSWLAGAVAQITAGWWLLIVALSIAAFTVNLFLNRHAGQPSDSQTSHPEDNL